MKLSKALAAAVGVILTVGALTVGGAATTAETAAAASPSCGYATSGTGKFADTICWVDFAGFNAADAMSSSGQRMSVALPGGYTASFQVKARPWTDPATGTVYTDVSSCVSPYSEPFLGQAYPLGGQAYKGIPGKPGLLNNNGQPTAGTIPASCYGAGKGTNLILDGIQVTDAGGAAVTDFGVVSTEAEASRAGEGIVWTSDVPLARLDQINPNGAGCVGGRVTGLGTNTVRCTGVTGSGAASYGTSLIFASSPTTFNTASVNPGQVLGTAYGFVTSSVRLNAVVHSGPGSFTVTAAADGGGTLATATTSGGTGTTGQVTVLTGGAFDLSLAAGSGTNLADYLQSWSCTRNGTVDPALTPSGATVTATPAIGDAIDCTVTLDLARPALSLVKSASPDDAASYTLGRPIVYTFTVTNTGNVPVTDIVAGDTDFSGDPDNVPLALCPSTSAPNPPLGPGETIVCTADPYHLTQADIDAGHLDNTGIAAGLSAYGLVQSDESIVTIPGNPTASLSLVKAVTPTTGTAAGDPVRYDFTVKNTGTVTLHGLTVSETAFTGTGTLSAVDCPADAATLSPGETQTCTAAYRLTQTDVDAGRVDNTAVASALSPADATVTSQSSSAAVTVPAAPALTVEKSASPSLPDDYTVGTKLTYSFVVTNTGNVTLSDIGIVEGAFTGSGTLPAPTCPAAAASLAPKAQVSCTTEYTIAQQDVDAGSIQNDATAVGTPPRQRTPVPSAPSTFTVPQPARPAVSLVKSADVQEVSRAGQLVHYSFTVTNTGNQTLSGPAIVEGAFTGHGALTKPTCPSVPVTLVPGQEIVCSATYTVVAADLTGQPLVNTATATATPPSTAPIVSAASTVRIGTVVPPVGPIVSVEPAAPEGGLPSTGYAIPPGIAVGALGAVVAGGLALLIRRRRRA